MALYNRAAFAILLQDTDKHQIAVILVSIDDYA